MKSEISFDPKTLPERFSSKIDFTDTCWLWKASKNPKGYGKYGIGKSLVYTHRYSWSFFNGEIPSGYVVMHSCDTPSCVSPYHLSVGTQRDNLADMVAKGRYPYHKSVPNKKFTKDEADEIRSLYVEKGFKIIDIARKYGVSITPIRRVLCRQKN